MEIKTIQEARKTEISNVELKIDAEKYLKELERTKQIFEQYEEAKKEIGIRKSKEMFGEQTKGFDSYLSYLQKEAAKVAIPITLGIGNIGDTTKLNGLLKEISDTQQKQAEIDFKKQIDNYKRLLEETESFAQKRLKVEAKYERDLDLLHDNRKNFSDEELKERERVLKELKDADLRALSESLAQQSEGWRKLNRDIISFTAARIDAEIKEIERLLEATDIDESTRKGLKQQLKDWKQQRKEIDGTKDSMEKAAKTMQDMNNVAGSLGNAFSLIASSVREMNGDLADSLENGAQLLSIFQDFLNVGASIMSGDIAGAISSTVSYLTKIVDFAFLAPKRSRIAAQKELEAFQAQVLAGELEVNRIYRLRALEQARLNELKLEGITAERKALEENRRAAQDDYNRVLMQLQKQEAVIGKTTEKHGGFFGIGRKTRTVDITESLAGKSYEELEKLFTEGKLEGKALELFEELQRIKEEGVDIDRMLEENKRQAQEMFTGTSADGITDVIINGLANGKRAVEDFADDTENIIRKALMNALKYQFLEGQIQELFEKFAADAEDGGGLDAGEIENFTNSINKTIEDAVKIAEQVEKATGIKLTEATGSASSSNTLQGAIKGITEQQAQLLASQFGGLRVTALNQLEIARQGLVVHQRIDANTLNTATNTFKMQQILEGMKNGSITIKVK